MMNKLVREHVPASELPKDWAIDLPEGAMVTVTVEPETASAPLDSLTGAQMHCRALSLQVRSHDPDWVSRMRDEWDDRVIR
jgi:hypothetical protein